MQLRAPDLDEFVSLSDRFGGPGAAECNQYWHDFSYEPTVFVDQELDPFSDEYYAAQIGLYNELSNREFEQAKNELGDIDTAAHISAANPYNHDSPSGLAVHLERLARALKFARPPLGGKMLDMGCGWGLSSEIAAYSGLDVTSIDINPQFVNLINQRAAAGSRRISAHQSSFDSFSADEQYDVIQFYECFHHAAKPWELIQRMAAHLKPEGKIVLSGEPVNQNWWKNWGLRLDALSVYCIRKFGWFESGWSQPFLLDAFQRSGLDVEVFDHADSDIGQVWVANLRGRRLLELDEAVSSWQMQGLRRNGDYIIGSGECALTPMFEQDTQLVTLQFENYRPRPINMTWHTDSGEAHAMCYPSGRHFLTFDRSYAGKRLHLDIEAWYPSVESGSEDNQAHGIHISKIFTFT
ncbi:class I SAM-dependent methyltransferase [Sphingobium sp. BYY-5]|uniref:class I SAM-dependent methyltransferase n=1 Tax=Sphingobium sp. BYY-5 TaxID=2926400 RepID=UPI001FA7A743|nr:class I SAM-dependent methyltransferase [Sphingobium sp. BYY-5]MCI4589699.1 class I SAM-dependent methyltransferase [Sphingobium sp. BYY-5]